MDKSKLQEIAKSTIKTVRELYPYLGRKTQRMAAKLFLNYDALRMDYFERVYDTVYAYLHGNKPITLYRNSIQNLTQDYFQQAAEIGWEDGGAVLPLGEATQGMIDGMISSQMGYIDGLFASLRDNAIDSCEVEAYQRAQGYSGGLDAAYNVGRTAAAGDQPLTLVGDDGAESCQDCITMKYQTHPASWWVENDMIPYPGNENYACKGYRCAHFLQDAQGNRWTK